MTAISNPSGRTSAPREPDMREGFDESAAMRLILNMCHSVMSKQTLDDQLQELCLAIRRHFKVSRVVVNLIDDSRAQIVGLVGTGLPAEYIRSKSYPLIDREGIEVRHVVPRVALRGEIEVCRDRTRDLGYLAGSARSDEERLTGSTPGRTFAKEFACFPLRTETQSYGVIMVTMMEEDGTISDARVADIASFIDIISLTILKAVEFDRLKKSEANEKNLQHKLLQSEKMRALGQILSGVAHELNNPIGSILGYTQLLLAAPMPEECKADVQVIGDEARRCSSIVQDLVAFARKSSSKREPCDVNRVLAGTLKLRAYELKMDNLQTKLDPDSGLPQTMANARQLQQVFLNLINNAVESMQDSPVRTLTLESRAAGDHIRVAIRDTGVGIAREDLARIFEPFYTMRPSGTGLGLSVCYGIVSDHGGRIWAESEPGKGTALFVELPMVRPPDDVVANGAAALSVGGNYEDILVVDDEPAYRQVFSRFLQSLGYRVTSASSVADAIRLIETNTFRMIVCDHRMPGRGGEELFRHVRDHHPSLAGHFLLVTGDTLNPATRRFIDSRHVCVLEKPFELEKLAEMVTRLLASETPA